jgi:L-ascorbate metabolism protein UlaG (beta-lactamase superfamily)
MGAMRRVQTAGISGLLCVGLLAHVYGQAPPGEGPQRSNRQADTLRTSQGDLRIMPVYHGSVMLEFNGKVIHIDPWSRGDYAGLPQADLLVITHTHADHLDRTMLERLKKPTTVIVAPPAVADTLNCCEVEAIANGETRTVEGISFEGVAMYNLVHGWRTGMPFHHRGIGSGYVLGFGDTRLYISGDTECVPEMKALKRITVAMFSMNPPKAMSPGEAADCVKAFKPAIAYPIHYRGQKPEDFAAALKGTGIEVRIRKVEGEP